MIFFSLDQFFSLQDLISVDLSSSTSSPFSRFDAGNVGPSERVFPAERILADRAVAHVRTAERARLRSQRLSAAFNGGQAYAQGHEGAAHRGAATIPCWNQQRRFVER